MFELLSDTAVLPTRATKGSAGYDLCANATITVTNKVTKIPTGVAVKCPPGTYAQVTIRSSLAMKNLVVNAGVIDSDYFPREVFVLMYSLDGEYTINAGERIAQVIFKKIHTDDAVDTERVGGFGSTGV